MVAGLQYHLLTVHPGTSAIRQQTGWSAMPPPFHLGLLCSSLLQMTVVFRTFCRVPERWLRRSSSFFWPLVSPLGGGFAAPRQVIPQFWHVNFQVYQVALNIMNFFIHYPPPICHHSSHLECLLSLFLCVCDRGEGAIHTVNNPLV